MNLRQLTIFSFLIIISGSLFAQQDTTYWTSGGFVALTFSQVNLSDSWSAGGSENTAINGATAVFADYKKARHTWENSLDMGYGLIKQGQGADFVKSDDKLNFVTKYGYRIKSAEGSNWFFSALMDFRTQFDEGYVVTDDGRDSLISNFMVPGYLTVGLGVDYKPNKKISFNYTPLTGKFTFVNNQALADKGAYGVDPGKKVRAELGSYFRVKYKDEVIQNVNLESRLELFSNYIEDFGVIDVNWQTTIVMKINKVLSANLYTHLLYDKDIKTETDEGVEEARVQFKNVFGAGLAYNFGAQKD